MQSRTRFTLLPGILAAGVISLTPLQAVEKSETDTIRVIIDPELKTQLSAQVMTPVEKINKRMGDSFVKGEVLIHLDDDIFQGNLLKAKAALEKAETELAAKQHLYKDNNTSLFDLKEAEAAAATAKAELIVAQKNLQSSTIIAPYDGKVVDLGIEEHELPQQGKNLIELVEDKTLLAKMLVPSSHYKDLKIGKEITIDIKETGQKIKAKISRIGAVIDPSSSTIRVEAAIDNSDGKLRAGMSGEAHL